METVSNKPIVYGFPLTGPDTEGLKVGVHGSNEVCTPETVCRDIRPEDEQSIRSALAETLPSLLGRLVGAETCLYTMTPDENFILGAHPKYPEVTLAAGFSGHGFKFAPVIGEIVGELVSSGRSRFDIRMFSPLRFASAMGESHA
jgi:sarcosine oxidase